MTLSEWIKESGAKKVAQLLNVDRATVSYWRSGKKSPRAGKMLRIHNLSGKRVSLESMLKTAAKNEK